MKFRIALPLCTALTLSAAAPVAAQSPNPNLPYIQSITYGGSGCPGGTVATSINSQRTRFTLIFDAFVASSGPGVPVIENRKNCQFNVNIAEPQGSGQFCAVFEYRGYIGLPAGFSAEGKATYYRTNSYELPDGQVIDIGNEGDEESGISHSQTFDGPTNNDYLRRDSDTWDYNNFEPRTRALNINSQVRVVGPPSTQAQMTTDSIDGEIIPGPCAVADTTAPTINVSNPVNYGLYGLGASVAPQFTCTDEEGGSGVASCTGAATLDTTSVGPKTFTVTAVDNAGNTSTASVSYAVGGKEECKGGGHNQFLIPSFKNQGQCVSTYAGKK